MRESDGGLRARLVAVGVDLVTDEGIQALSLREIARRAGVSHGAPRRYFPTHVELLSAIARRGFTDLDAQITQALAATPANPREQLMTLGRVYVDYALSHRGMFELMFRHDLLESGYLGLRGAGLPLFGILVDLVAKAQPDSQASTVAGALWANLHGVAQLWIWGSMSLATGLDDVAPVLRAAMDAHLCVGERVAQ